MLDECRLCPRECGVNRNKKDVGVCGAPSSMVIARYSLHMWEEPCISGSNGSGTIFFSGCNLKCIFCQNYMISSKVRGTVVDIEQFSDICLKLQNNGANNINLVTGVMYIPKIIEGILLARESGLSIPIIYNSSGYEKCSSIKLLDGIVDVYLPDFKYWSDDLALKYSKCCDYRESVIKAIDGMYNQVGKVVFDDEGNIVKGVIVRHLVLPGCLEDSKKVLNYLYNKYGNNIYISIMNQYTPVRKVNIDSLDRTLQKREYDEIIDYAYDLGIRNAYVQEDETQKESFIPDFFVFDGLDNDN